MRRPGVESGQRDAQTFSFGEKNIFPRHAYVVKLDDRIVERPQPHEVAALHDLDAGRVHLDDERGDLILAAPMPHFRRRFRHDDDDTGARAIRAPEFSPLRMKRSVLVGSACVSMRAGSEPTPGSVSAKAEISPLATRGRNFWRCALGAKEEERLRNADGLVRGDSAVRLPQ